MVNCFYRRERSRPRRKKRAFSHGQFSPSEPSRTASPTSCDLPARREFRVPFNMDPQMHLPNSGIRLGGIFIIHTRLNPRRRPIQAGFGASDPLVNRAVNPNTVHLVDFFVDCSRLPAHSRPTRSSDWIAGHLSFEPAWPKSSLARRDPLVENFSHYGFHPRCDGLRGKGLAWLPVFDESPEWRE